VRLTTASIIPLNKAKYRLFPMTPEKNSTVIPIYHVRVIAIPPPFGVGTSCRLLSFGITVISFLTAKRIIMYVIINERTPREKIVKIIRMKVKIIRLNKPSITRES
jgi:hypothetical protein